MSGEIQVKSPSGGRAIEPNNEVKEVAEETEVKVRKRRKK